LARLTKASEGEPTRVEKKGKRWKKNGGGTDSGNPNHTSAFLGIYVTTGKVKLAAGQGAKKERQS